MLSPPLVHLLGDWSTLFLPVMVAYHVLPTKEASQLIVLSHYADMSVGMISLALNLPRCRHAQYPRVLKELMTSSEVSKSLQWRWI